MCIMVSASHELRLEAVSSMPCLDGTRCTWIERACVAFLPGSPDPAKDRRIDDVLAERLDKRHVERGEPGHGLHIDRPVQAIADGSLSEHGRQEGVHGRVPHLCQRLPLKNVQDTERAVRCTGGQSRTTCDVAAEPMDG